MENEQTQLIIAAGLIQDVANKVLLIKRSDNVKRAPGKWELVSGKVLYGEEPLDALPRIAKQLVGFEVEAGKLIHSRSFVSKKHSKHILIFYNEAKPVNEINEIKLADGFVSAQWVDITDLQQYELEVGTKEALDKYNTHLLDEHKINKVDDSVATSDALIIHTDGGSRGNPGPSASGFVIQNQAGEVLEEGGEYLGITTNNQAEYQAVKLALQAAKKHGARKLHFKIDSLLVVNQMNGVYKIKSKDLWPIHEDIKKLAKEYDEVTFEHVYRENNVLADAKVNEVLDSRQ